MKKQWFPILWIIVMILSGCSAAPTPQPTIVVDAQIEARMERVEQGLIPITMQGEIESWEPQGLLDRMQHYQVPGIGIAVIQDFQIEWAKGYGVLREGGADPVTTESLFHAGSVAKPVSAAATLTLVERGLLDLDANVNGSLQSWQVPDNEFTVDEKVTLRRLLSHSSGIQDGFTNRSSSDSIPTYAVPAGEVPTVTLQELLDAEHSVDVDERTRVTTVPGASYRYANANYAILELLITDVLQQPYSEFMHETVLEPLGMTSSTFEQPLPGDLRRRATTEHDSMGHPMEGERLHFPFLAAGGLWTTSSDLAVFAVEIMNAYQGMSDALLDPAFVQAMVAPQIATLDNAFGHSYGLGFHLGGEGQDLLLFHTGGTWGSTCLIWLYPERGQGAIIMTNSASWEGAIRFEILISLAMEYGWPLAVPGS
ncbi:MAG TPA: beta-lactamase family protein [Anaerolineae bacterium]|nr:beta-lactamase family protein [Anaerolineae bacterium]